MVNIKQLVVARLAPLTPVIPVFAMVFSLVISGLLLGPSIALAQDPPVEGIKIAPTPFPAVPPGVDIPPEIDVQFFDGIGPDGMAIAPVRTELENNVYYITDGNYQSMVILHSGGNGIILVDAPEPLPFAGSSSGIPPFDIVGVLETQFPNVPVTHLIYSHSPGLFNAHYFV